MDNDDETRNENEALLNAARIQLLDAYFLHRSKDPAKNELTNKDYVSDNKSTCDIKNELSEMMVISDELIVAYLVKKHYGITIDDDGTVKWEIWRDYNPID